MTKKWLVALACAALGTLGCAGEEPTSSDEDDDFADLEAALQAGFDPGVEFDSRVRHNNHRHNHVDAPALENRTCLKEIARAWAKHLAQSSEFEHNPNLAQQVNNKCSFQWAMLGENIAKGSSEQDIFQAWLQSSGHHENIDRQRFRRVGIGAYRDGDTLWMVVNFADPR
jgi:uncharacterized protein YkwD